LLESSLPRLTARAGSGDWRTEHFDRDDDQAVEDLSKFAGIARGRNVVMVSLESTAAQYLSLYGGKYEVMPNLGGLASRALVFDNAYAVYPESIKGLFSVLCSVFPSFDSEPKAYEKAPCRALPAALAAEGYRTGLFHSGLFGYLGMESIIRHRGYQTMEDAGDIGGNHHSSFGVDEPVTVRRMLAWIDALPRGQRFFLTYLPIAGHHPYATPAPGPFAGSEEIDQYRDALHYGDVSLGALRDGLRLRGLEDNTLWVVYGDHGEAFGQHPGNYAHTFFLYEENVHVPFLIAVPGLKGGLMTGQKRVSKVVSLVDIAPTILNLLGITPPADLQGRTMLDGTRRMALFFTDYSLGILGLRDGPRKFTYEIESGRLKLFDLRSDQQEVTDLAGQNGARALWYRNLLREWSSAQKAWIAQTAR
jgi:phosphoglycerol transferase MdoB-like AlkP superfamily enzyme